MATFNPVTAALASKNDPDRVLALCKWSQILDGPLEIHGNPAYISSLGEDRASVSGSCGKSTAPVRTVADKDPTVGTVKARPATVDPNSFGRYLLDVARG